MVTGYLNSRDDQNRLKERSGHDEQHSSKNGDNEYMLFGNLKSAFADIDTLGDYNLDRLIKHYDIDAQYSNMTHTINGYTLPLTRTIFINNQLEYTERIKAHKLMHCLLDDTVQPLIESIMVDDSKTENRADRGAFYVMIKEYIELTSI